MYTVYIYLFNVNYSVGNRKFSHAVIYVSKEGSYVNLQVVTQENYYDQNGVLLLARGVMVSEALIKKLKQRNLLGLASFKSSQYSQAEQVHIITAELRERINVRDTQLLEYSSQILSSIIFKSKEKPCGLALTH